MEHVLTQTASVALLLCAMFIAMDCSADVYVWKDPQTGATRITSMPPPWLKSPGAHRRAPKVEVIRGTKVMDPATAAATPQAEARPKPAPRAEQDEGPDGSPGAGMAGTGAAANPRNGVPGTIQPTR